jgi:hypothetical protein
MKSSLLLVGLLFFVSAAQAQHSHMPIMTGGGTGGSGYGYGGYGYGGWGSGWGSNSFGDSGRPVRYEDPRSFSVEYAQNDGPFVPSTYMNYEDALALGRQQLAAAVKAEQGDATPSLGDVARSYRAVRVPTLKLQSRVIQDGSGNLVICNLNGNNCRRP